MFRILNFNLIFFEKDLAIPKAKSTVIMEDFSESPSLKIHGSIGSKIAKELNLNISGSDTMSMTIKLGDIIKNEVSLLLFYSVTTLMLGFKKAFYLKFIIFI